MFESFIFDYAKRLADFINEKKFDPITQRTPYYNMGATITDSILQAGLNYEHVVYPRIKSLLINFSDYKTTCDFLILIQTIPLEKLINWKNEKKLKLIHDLAWYLFDNGIENENQLSKWLSFQDNTYKLIQINGIGPKTIDYLSMLSGNQTIAIDRHLFEFLEMVGILVKSYKEANQIYTKAAEILKVSNYELDRKVWLYMSKKKTFI